MKVNKREVIVPYNFDYGAIFFTGIGEEARGVSSGGKKEERKRNEGRERRR